MHSSKSNADKLLFLREPTSSGELQLPLFLRQMPSCGFEAVFWLSFDVAFLGLKLGFSVSGLVAGVRFYWYLPSVSGTSSISIPALPTTIFVDSEMARKFGATATARVAAQCSVSSQNQQGHFRSLRPRSRKIYEKRTALL